MVWLLQVTIAAVSAFAATNIDDIIVSMFFFSQVNQNLRVRHIVIGNYLGFIVLIIASLLGFLGGLIIPKTWIGLLGFVPVAIGLKQIFEQEEEETIPVQTISKSGQKRVLNIPFSQLFHPQTYSVAAITIANGGDNIGIYVPFFASLDWRSLLLTLTIFLILVGVWSLIAYSLTRHRLIAKVLTRYGQRLVPFVFIGLGIFILLDSHSYELFPFWQ